MSVDALCWPPCIGVKVLTELKEFEQVLLYTVPHFKSGSFCYATVAEWGYMYGSSNISLGHTTKFGQNVPWY